MIEQLGVLMFRRWWLGCLALALGWGVASTAHADGEGLHFLSGGAPTWQAPEIPGVRALGMGSGGLALADGPEAFYINPAGLGMMDYSYVEAGFYFHPNADNRVFNVSVADGKTNPYLAGGLSYSYYIASRPDDGKFQSIYGHIVRLGTAFTYKRVISIGVVLKYTFLERPFHTPLSTLNMDVGVTWRIIPGLQISAVGYNLIYNDTGETPIALGFGVAFGGLKNLPLRLSLDYIADFQSRHRIAEGEVGHELRAGASFTFAKMLTVRLGYQYDQARGDKHYITAGLGFKYKQFGVEAAFRQQLATGEFAYNHFFGFTALLYF